MRQITPKIIGVGSEVGSEIITNKYLCGIFDVSDESIVERTGIRERRRAAEDEFTSTLAVSAAIKALKSAGLNASEIDVIICATISPDYFLMPSTACLIQAELGAKRALAFDISAACSGFLYALETAINFIKSGAYQNILVVGADLMTRYIDCRDFATSALFADGAGAVAISKSLDDSGILASEIGADGNFADYIKTPAGGTRLSASCETVNNRQHFMKMRGRELFKMAVNKMSACSRQVIEKSGISGEELKIVIPHQANQRIIDAVAAKLNLPKEKVFSNIEFIGNTGAASIPIAIDRCLSENRIEKGDYVLLTAFGGGVTWGATLLRW